MLNVNDATVRPEIQGLVQEILLENSRYKRELRSFHREVLVCPVVLRFNGDDEEQHCVSRNISSSGISVISSNEFFEHQRGALEIYRLTDVPSSEILAECRWCKRFGTAYWMSGWQFVHLISR